MRMRPIICVALGLLVVAPPLCGEAAESEAKFSDQARTLIEGQWTRLRVAYGLYPDAGDPYAVAVEIIREEPKAAMRIRQIHEAGSDFRPLGEAQWQGFLKSLYASAVDVEAEITPAEKMRWIHKEMERDNSAENLKRLWKKYEMPNGWDVDFFIVRSDEPNRSASAINYGTAEKWGNYVAEVFDIRGERMGREKFEEATGINLRYTPNE